MNPAIVINCYNRPRSLARLMQSIQNAQFPEGADIPLVISLDNAGRHPEVETVAQNFRWSNGPKVILRHTERLGLVGHFFACGDLTQQYGAIVYLEDDLFVSPVFYFFASQALEFYKAEARIAGISLYRLGFNGYTRQPFIPYPDEADVFFVQVPYTQGEAFTADQWNRYCTWRSVHPHSGAISTPMHESWSRFQPDEWFPDWARYLSDTHRFFVYPRVSLSTGFGDAGSHFAKPTGFFQVPLQQEKIHYQMKALDNSLAVYDSYFEILPERLNRLTDAFQEYSFSVDFYATRTKTELPTEYILTTRYCRKPLLSFGKTMRPPEANVIYKIPGEGVFFCRKEDLAWGWRAELKTWAGNRAYFSGNHISGLRDWIKDKLAILLR
jgi:hypothetical protein